MSDSLTPKTNATVGSVVAPTAGALTTGELAENKYTGRLYIEKEDGTVVDCAITRLTGDLSGTTQAPTSNTDGGTIAATVAKIQGFAVTTTAPAALQTLIWSTTQNAYIPGSASVANFPLSSVPATTGQLLQYQLNTDGVQRWTPATIPTIKALCRIDLLAVTGKAYVRASTTVTVTYTAHGYSTGDVIQVTAATDSGINQSGISITKIDANSFRFTTTATGANGTLTIRNRLWVNSINVSSVKSNAVGDHSITLTTAIATPTFHASVTNDRNAAGGAYIYTVRYATSTQSIIDIETISSPFDIDVTFTVIA